MIVGQTFKFQLLNSSDWSIDWLQYSLPKHVNTNIKWFNYYHKRGYTLSLLLIRKFLSSKRCTRTCQSVDLVHDDVARSRWGRRTLRLRNSRSLVWHSVAFWSCRGAVVTSLESVLLEASFWFDCVGALRVANRINDADLFHWIALQSSIRFMISIQFKDMLVFWGTLLCIVVRIRRIDSSTEVVKFSAILNKRRILFNSNWIEMIDWV